MQLLSRILSSIGLLALVAGVVLFLQTGPEGTVLRWDLLGLSLLAAVLCFVAAWRIGPRR